MPRATRSRATRSSTRSSRRPSSRRPARAGDEPRTTPLSKREREILQRVADGATTRQVASDLGISPHTVKTHLERIFEKLGANDRAQAVAIAIRTGIVH